MFTTAPRKPPPPPDLATTTSDGTIHASSSSVPRRKIVHLVCAPLSLRGSEETAFILDVNRA